MVQETGDIRTGLQTNAAPDGRCRSRPFVRLRPAGLPGGVGLPGGGRDKQPTFSVGPGRILWGAEDKDHPASPFPTLSCQVQVAAVSAECIAKVAVME